MPIDIERADDYPTFYLGEFTGDTVRLSVYVSFLREIHLLDDSWYLVCPEVETNGKIGPAGRGWYATYGQRPNINLFLEAQEEKGLLNRDWQHTKVVLNDTES